MPASTAGRRSRRAATSQLLVQQSIRRMCMACNGIGTRFQRLDTGPAWYPTPRQARSAEGAIAPWGDVAHQARYYQDVIAGRGRSRPRGCRHGHAVGPQAAQALARREPVDARSRKIGPTPSTYEKQVRAAARRYETQLRGCDPVARATLERRIRESEQRRGRQLSPSTCVPRSVRDLQGSTAAMPVSLARDGRRPQHLRPPVVDGAASAKRAAYIANAGSARIVTGRSPWPSAW